MYEQQQPRYEVKLRNSKFVKVPVVPPGDELVSSPEVDGNKTTAGGGIVIRSNNNIGDNPEDSVSGRTSNMR